MREEGYEDCFQTSQKYMEKDYDSGLEVAKHLNVHTVYEREAWSVNLIQ